MSKIYILDTTVILHDAEAIMSFPDEKVIVLLDVIEAVDRFKREMNELGRNAREFNRKVDSFRRKGSLQQGIELPNGCIFQIMVDPSQALKRQEQSTNRQVLQFAQDLQRDFSSEEVVVVSQDLNLRVKANALGLEAEAFEKNRFEEVLDYQGRHDLEISLDELDEYQRLGCLDLSEREGFYHPNEFLCLRVKGDPHHNIMAKTAPHDARVAVPLEYGQGEMAGIRALNMEQLFTMEALLNPKIKLITLQGAAGTGKTLLAVAAGLQQVLSDFTYNKVLISRPTIPMGKDIGFLPGDIKEKMMPWMQPIFDSLELIKTLDRRSRKPILPADLTEMDEIKIEPLTYIRGRSIPDQYLIIDEAQNLSPLEAKTIITRLGKNSKIVMTGDVEQIDHPYMDAYSNGLAYVAGRFRDSSLAAHIKLQKGERSELAEEAVKLL